MPIKAPKKEKPTPLVVRKRLRIRSRQGLHARPAALFVQVANRFKSFIRVKKGGEEVDGKSIMGILTLAASKGSTILVTAEGPDAKDALHALEQIISHDEIPAVVTVVKQSNHGSSAS